MAPALTERDSVRLKKDEDDTEIGLGFETPLMDEKHTCRNKCIFCFIDQNPKGMRETVYFKDDDSRLSFLHGNFITLTNLHDEDIDRIIGMHISPINVSVHTTDPELRVRMMHNKRAGLVLDYLPRLAAAGIRLCLDGCGGFLCGGNDSLRGGRVFDVSRDGSIVTEMIPYASFTDVSKA